MELDLSKSLNAVCITSHTLVGTINDGKYPYKHGNCFSMQDDTGKEYRIINFNHENMKEAIKRGVSYPIKILPLDERIAIIADSRIPDDWYADKFCAVCTPKHLLSIPQRLKLELSVDRGETTFRNMVMPNGDIIILERSIVGKRPDIRTKEEIKEKEEKLSNFLSRIVVEPDITAVHGFDIDQEILESLDKEIESDMERSGI
jgi:hypothetical protein